MNKHTWKDSEGRTVPFPFPHTPVIEAHVSNAYEGVFFVERDGPGQIHCENPVEVQP